MFIFLALKGVLDPFGLSISVGVFITEVDLPMFIKQRDGEGLRRRDLVVFKGLTFKVEGFN
jgi:hypothetical protein